MFLCLLHYVVALLTWPFWYLFRFTPGKWCQTKISGLHSQQSQLCLGEEATTGNNVQEATRLSSHAWSAECLSVGNDDKYKKNNPNVFLRGLWSCKGAKWSVQDNMKWVKSRPEGLWTWSFLLTTFEKRLKKKKKV